MLNRKLVKDHFWIIAIASLGIYLRTHGAIENFLYSHDQDLLGWFVRDVVENRHLRLIGQETSQQGVFVGPLFYYLMIPFYLLFGMDPLGGLFGVIIIAAFTIFSLYFVVSKIFAKKSGLVISFLYSTSLYSILNDREVVPTQPTVLWSVWFFYSVWLVLKKKKNGFYIAAFLLGIAWNINLSLILFLPVFLLSWFLSKKKLEITTLTRSVILFIAVFLPFLFFEARHGFNMTKAVLFKTSSSEVIVQGSGGDFERVITLLSKNVANILGTLDLNLNHLYWLAFLLSILFYLFIKNIVGRKIFILLLVWVTIPVIFFSVNPIILSEYYLNGTTFIWFLLIALFIGNHKKIGFLFLIIFTVLNIFRYINLPRNKSGYLYRKNLVGYIKKDSIVWGYPCIAISYITKPGYDFGYRYFYYLESLHVNKPISGSPVYTIVYPLRGDIDVDKTFGIIGLIYPDYSKYTKEDVLKSCSGEDSNLTDPMFGFTQ